MTLRSCGILVLSLLVGGCQQRESEPVAMPDDEFHRMPADEFHGMSHPRLADALAQAPSAKDEILDDKGGDLELEAIRLTAPAGWGRKAASSAFVAAEYMLPRAEGDDNDGRLTISTAGGSVDANIDRWRGQFGGEPTKETEEKLNVEGLEVTVVDFSGDFADQRGMMGPTVNRKDYRMLAAIIPVDEQLHFIKAYGPQKTMEQHAAAFTEFVRSARKK